MSLKFYQRFLIIDVLFEFSKKFRFYWDIGNRLALKKQMDSTELSKLMDCHFAALGLYAKQWCQCPEDVVQDAFVKLAQRMWQPRNRVAWLYKVVRNGAISASRSERRRWRHENRAGRMANDWFQTESSSFVDTQEIQEHLQDLPLSEREVIIAHLWGGLTFSEIADVVGTSSSTAHRRYLTGLQTLRERLGVPCRTKEKI